MIVKKLRTVSGTVSIRIPTNISEITVGQTIDAQNWTEDKNTVPYIEGLTKEICDNILDIADSRDIQERCLSLAHQIKYCYNETKIPKYLVFGTKKVKRFGFYFEIENRVKVLNNLSIEPAGAFMASRDLIVDEINRHIGIYGEDGWKENLSPSLDSCAGILAHYFYCHATGNLWSEQKAEAFKSEILKLSIQDVLPVARFFFLNYNNLLNGKTTYYQQFKQILKKRLELKRLKSSGI